MNIIKFFLIFFLPLLQISCEEERLTKIIDFFPEKLPEDITLQKLGGGLTNTNYKIDLDSKSYFVRKSYVQNYLLDASLEREWKCASIASAHGLSPKIISYFPDKRLLFSEFIETDRKPINLKDPNMMRKFCNLVKSLHNLDETFPTHFCPFQCIDFYKNNALNAKAPLPPVLLNVVLPQIEELKQLFTLSTKAVPCHLDLHSGNILDDGNKFWLIDWEYAAMGDPLFDLATAASVDNFSDQQMAELLALYLKDGYVMEDFIYFYFMRILADLRWALWSYLQIEISPIDEPFEEFGDLFLQHCMERMFIFYDLLTAEKTRNTA